MGNNHIDTKLLEQIKHVLSDFPKYWENETLLKNKLIEDIRSYEETIIKAMLSNELIKNTYSITFDDITVFKVEDFISMLRYKNYWENSYTKYSNEIGLTSEGKYLKYNTDVVLDFPHKDAVLEGGMIKEDQGQEEMYYHNVLAKEEIDTLLSPKILSNANRIDADGEHDITKFEDTDNLIIKGNNLIALHTLKERYAGKVKLIYIDPPYNTGNDSFKYNDRFNHSTWLTFMKNRLEIAKVLMSNNGLLWISIDDTEFYYLKILCDEIYGEENFIADITYERSGSAGLGQGGVFVNNSEHILVYKKENLSINEIPGSSELGLKTMKRYNKILKQEGSSYLIKEFKSASNGKPVKIYEHSDFEIETISLRDYENRKEEIEHEYKNNFELIFRTNNVQKENEFQNRLLKEMSKSKLYTVTYTPSRGKYKDQETTLYYYNAELFAWLKDTAFISNNTIMKTNKLTTVWKHEEIPKADLANEGGVQLSRGKKPEQLLRRLIELSTDENDIILDFFMGSATTQAVAHKMNRQYVGIEQMNYINKISVPRLQKVIGGEESGISKDVNWQGGGSFVYVELHELNKQFVDSILTTQSEEELVDLIKKLKSEAFLDFKVDIDRVTNDDKEFNALSLEEKKDALIKSLDANQMYLSYSEIDDAEYGSISDAVKQFNRSFYEGGEET